MPAPDLTSYSLVDGECKESIAVHSPSKNEADGLANEPQVSTTRFSNSSRGTERANSEDNLAGFSFAIDSASTPRQDNGVPIAMDSKSAADASYWPGTRPCTTATTPMPARTEGATPGPATMNDTGSYQFHPFDEITGPEPTTTTGSTGATLQSSTTGLFVEVESPMMSSLPGMSPFTTTTTSSPARTDGPAPTMMNETGSHQSHPVEQDTVPEPTTTTGSTGTTLQTSTSGSSGAVESSVMSIIGSTDSTQSLENRTKSPSQSNGDSLQEGGLTTTSKFDDQPNPASQRPFSDLTSWIMNTYTDAMKALDDALIIKSPGWGAGGNTCAPNASQLAIANNCPSASSDHKFSPSSNQSPSTSETSSSSVPVELAPRTLRATTSHRAV